MIWFNYSGTQGYAGKLTSIGVFEIIYKNSGGSDVALFVDGVSGKAIGEAGPLNNVGFITNVINSAAFAGVEINEVVPGIPLEVGDDVPDWSLYEVLD